MMWKLTIYGWSRPKGVWSLSGVHWRASSISPTEANTYHDYSWKVNSSWDEAKLELSLTIKNTTLEDDQGNTAWECLILEEENQRAFHSIEVRGE